MNNQSFAERFKQAVAHAGVQDTQESLGKLIGVSPVMVWSYRKGEKIPRMSTALRIAKALNVRVEWLLTGAGPMSDAPSPDNNKEPVVSGLTNVYAFQHQGVVPLLSTVQAGQFCEAESRDYSCADEWLPRMPGHGPNTFALRVDGDSMTSPYPGAKSYPHGTIIYVDPDLEAKNGSAVVVKSADSHEVTFKLLVRDAGKTFFKPINPQYPMIEATGEYHICGVVRGSYTPE